MRFVFINDNFSFDEIKLIKEMFDKYDIPYVLIDKEHNESSAYNIGVETLKKLIKY